MSGSIELFLGTMFSGKTKRAMQEISKSISGNNYILFQSSWNKRDGNVWKSRGLDYVLPATVIDINSSDFLERMDGLVVDKEFVGIDEPFSFVYSPNLNYEKDAPVYAKKLAELVIDWKCKNKKIFIPSVHAFFNKKPVHFISEIYGHVDKAEFCVESTCVKCNRPASLTQRTFNGIPSEYNEPLLVLDGEKNWDYFPVCSDHFIG
jgi:thymidine kinase